MVTKTKTRWPHGTAILMALGLAMVMAGCSYTPAHLRTEPLITVDGHHGDYPRRHEQDDQGENDNAQ